MNKRRYVMTRNSIVGMSVVGAVVVSAAVILSVRPERADAHCQVPCGIYDDAARIARMYEDATTIEKAVAAIGELSGKHSAQAFNQAARWVSTKEDHASHIIEVVSQYFLTQKVKPAKPGSDEFGGYVKKLVDHHAVMAAAMKTKQNADPKYVAALRTAIDALAEHYK
jgi:nickel superoxide dismutase